MSALITTETFHEIPVRIVQGENGPMIPLVDIAQGIGYERQTLRHLYERNEELLNNYSQGVMMTAPGSVAPTEHICLTRDGISGILVKVEYKRIKDPIKREKVLSFQKWAIETLGKVMEGKPHQNQPLLPPLSDALKEEMARADAMRIVGVDIGLASSVCLAKLEDEYHTDLSYLRNLLTRKDDRDISYLTATRIGQILGMSAQNVNTILEKSGYLKHSERVKKTGKRIKVWNLTDKGRRFGEIHIGRYGGAETYIIMWRDSIIDELRNVLYNIDKSQQGLLSGECGV